MVGLSLVVAARDAVLATVDQDSSLVSDSQHSLGKKLRNNENTSVREKRSPHKKIHSQLRSRMKADFPEVF